MKPVTTRRQRQILAAIRVSNAVRGFPPTVREIGQLIGLKSPASVKYQLDRMVTTDPTEASK